MLAFVTKSGEHAIVEVVFGFRLSRPWSTADLEKLAANHVNWKAKLPKISRHEFQQIMIGEGVKQAISLPGGPGISFEKYQPNGDLAWRLRCEGDSIYVNCLEYSRWSQIWPETSNIMKDVFEVIGIEKVSIAGTLLQYIDVFDWDSSPSEYNVFQLLNRNSDFIPESVNNYGLAWHLHQGWFTQLNEPLPGRLLHKAHFDALPQNEAGIPTVRLDTLLRYDFDGVTSSKNFSGESSLLDQVFVEMHKKHKTLLLDFLNKEMCVKIGLRVSP